MCLEDGVHLAAVLGVEHLATKDGLHDGTKDVCHNTPTVHELSTWAVREVSAVSNLSMAENTRLPKDTCVHRPAGDPSSFDVAVHPFRHYIKGN